MTGTKITQKFGEIKSNRSTTFSILPDSNGNVLKIQLTATDEQQLRRFIQYQVRQNRKGIGVQFWVIKRSRRVPVATISYKCLDISNKQIDWKGLSISLQKSGYRYKGIGNIKMPWEVLQNEFLDFPLDNEDIIDVEFSVTAGAIKLQLYEFTDLTRSLSKLCAEKEITPIDGTVKIVGEKRHIGNWNIRIIGLKSKNQGTFRSTMMW
ncbi:MAG: hypothetical protein B6D41_13170 [Chloroflexi bacterium UTCFX4]|nr:MAG: hypothetical protein B6D41_13170 [Chloroflexi bacterium UTCFX4]